MIKLYPYIAGSASVKKLKEALNIKALKLKGSTYRAKAEDVIINWGNSRRIPNLDGATILNKPESVAVAVNKLLTLQALEEKGIPTLEYTTDKGVAQDWLREADKVYVRQNLTGHSGDGIEVIKSNGQPQFAIQQAQQMLDDAGLEEVADLLNEDYQRLADEEQDVPDAPLYTKGIENIGEYRVHVFKGEVILYQKKSRRVENNEPTPEELDVRNLASNWVYRIGNLNRLERVEQLAIDTIEALDLDFGAVDIIKGDDGNVFVLEVNTAVGLGNDDTINAYVEAFKTLENK